MKVICIDTAASTNSWVAENASRLDVPSLVYAREQTSGRGQRGNSWEAAPGKNLTASVLMVPHGVEPARQFVISEAVALAVADMLAEWGVEATVKWPNDIYVGDRKICGILIEHSIMGREITRTIAGIGVNINQENFLSDAPNPVSVWQLSGKVHDIAGAARLLADKIEGRMSLIGEEGRVHGEFMGRLWRGDGELYPFRDETRAESILARISGIDPDGILSLELPQGEVRRYAFKEVSFIIK